MGRSQEPASEMVRGTLDREQLRKLVSTLQRNIKVESALPASEGFQPLSVTPGGFATHIMKALTAENVAFSACLVEDTASYVLGKTCKDEGYNSVSSMDSLESSTIPPNTVSLRFLLCAPSDRDELSITRDVVIAVLRSVAYGITSDGDDDDADDDIPDHMIAGAYLRKMMVVAAPEYGPDAHAAIFTVAAFEDNPDILTVRFVARGSGFNIPDGLAGVHGEACDTVLLKSANMEGLLGLGTLVMNATRQVLGAPATSFVDAVPVHAEDALASSRKESGAGEDMLEDEDSVDGLGTSADQLRAEIKLWEAMQSTELPVVHYCRIESAEMTRNRNKQQTKGPSALEQLKDGCTAAGDSIANCWAKTCYGEVPTTEEETGMTAPSPADEEPRTPVPAVRVSSLIHEHGQVPLTI
eukprot:m.534525 g.534525  ORF g.534525 m.534525 type:complete len:412 (-) comp22055_c0_seq1:245-1480(-)